MSIARLREISPPPAHPVNADGDWNIIEEQLELKLPEDYRALIEHYGTGSFGDFLNLINPFHGRGNFLIRMESNILSHEREMHEEFPEERPLPVYPEPGGLFPWATTDNGDTLYWLTEGPPEQWPVVVWESRGPEHVVYPFGATEFLERWLAGTLECPVFPKRHEYFDPEFTPPRTLSLAYVYFGPVAGTFEEQLAAVMAFVGATKIKHRHLIQCRFLADPGSSSMTFTGGGPPGPSLAMAFPGETEAHYRRLIGRIRSELGWPIRFILEGGRQIWPEIPQDSDPRLING